MGLGLPVRAAESADTVSSLRGWDRPPPFESTEGTFFVITYPVLCVVSVPFFILRVCQHTKLPLDPMCEALYLTQVCRAGVWVIEGFRSSIHPPRLSSLKISTLS